MVHYYYPSSGQALCQSFVRGSHLLPSQLPGEHTGHMAASRCGEPFLECTLFLHLPSLVDTHFTYPKRDGGLHQLPARMS